ncbi:MAG TPA: hypothetical protein VE960_06170, partial [bacterium]|nr:hypothetical protein [bacterium]
MSSRVIEVTMLAAALVFGLAVIGPAVASTMKLSAEPVPGEQDAPRDIQETIWFQGYLADSVSGDPVDATYTVVARMYDASSGGSSVWGPETHVGTSIAHGWFDIELGSVVSPLP